MATFKVTRVFIHYVNGIPQVSDFQDSPPPGRFDLEVRIKHFTEIENFTLLGELLARHADEDMDDDEALEPISTIQSLVVPDAAVQADIEVLKTQRVTTERLGALILDRGLNWEHFVASFNANMIPGQPLKVDATFNGVPVQPIIDSLDQLTEALVSEVNLRVMRRGRRKGE